MEEILASIRRIISDDEQNATRKSAASQSHHDDEGLEAVEGEADDTIINDIARVLGGSAKAPEEGAPAAVEEEDILDLTAELGGLVVEDEMILVEGVVEEAPVEASAPPEVVQPAPAMPEPQPEPEPQAEDKAPEPAVPPPPLSASDEAASALERAIAALRAGQLPTSFSEFSKTQPEPVPQPVPPVFVAAPAPEPELESGPELVLTQFEAEVFVEEPIIEEPVVLEAIESEPQEAPAWEAEAPSFAVEREAAFEAPRVNGGRAHQTYPAADASQRTLEDSIKDMLRPMLRKWLDENMARVLTSALKDELRDNPARFERD